MNRAHGTGACRIHHAVCPAQIKAVADSSGNHIAQQPRKRIFLPRHIRLSDALNHFFSFIRRNAGIFQGFAPFWMSESCAQRNHQFLCSGYAENYADLIPVKLSALAVSCVFQCAFCRSQRKQLGSVRSFKRCGRNAKFRRIKGNWR